jgi:hypothetical protein
MTAARREQPLGVGDLVRLSKEAADRLQRGDPAGAVAAYQPLRATVREAMMREPGQPDFAQELARVCSALGECHLKLGAAAAAIDALTEAESAYQRLASLAGPPLPIAAADGTVDLSAVTSVARDRAVRRRAADAVLLRGVAHAMIDHPASAIVDVQHATMVYLPHLTRDVDERVAPDLARVLVWTAQVQLRYGDRDLAVAAADHAVSIYLEAFRHGEGLAIPPAEAGLLLLAARVAAVVHSVAGRGDLARQRERLVASLNGVGLESSDHAIIRGMKGARTLAQALAPVDRELAAALTVPAIERRILVPMMRCAPGQAASYASRLADLASRTLVADTPAGIRLVQEAHALFAGSRRPPTGEQPRLAARHDLAWARILLAAASTYAHHGEHARARDFSEWLTGVTDRLLHSVQEEDSRGLVEECARWQESFYRSIGNRDEAVRRGAVVKQVARRRSRGG